MPDELCNLKVGWTQRVPDQVEFGLRLIYDRVELELMASFCSISLARSGSSISPRLLEQSAKLLLFAEITSSSLGLVRWLSKPLEPLVMQT